VEVDGVRDIESEAKQYPHESDRVGTSNQHCLRWDSKAVNDVALPRVRRGEKWEGTHFARLIVKVYEYNEINCPMSGQNL
jgi:hypothetical protein